jgi:hypothetical protein
MTDTPETDNLARGNHVVPTEFAEQLERQRDEAVRSCHIWQKGHAELVAERDLCVKQIDYLLNLLQCNQPERKHIGRWGHNRQEFTSPYINQTNE